MITLNLTSTQRINAGASAQLQFQAVNNEQPETNVELELVHDKPLHLIIVSEDLSFFSHQHPEYANGTYQLEFTFPYAGKYLLYADYKPTGSPARVDLINLEVFGDAIPSSTFTAEKLTAGQDGIAATLDIHNTSAIKVNISRENNKIDLHEIQDFLGAKAHVVMIHQDTKEFLHVHPMTHHNDLVLHANFSQKGLYRAWVQFLIQGKLFTLDYTFSIHELPMGMMHMHH